MIQDPPQFQRAQSEHGILWEQPNTTGPKGDECSHIEVPHSIAHNIVPVDKRAGRKMLLHGFRLRSQDDGKLCCICDPKNTQCVSPCRGNKPPAIAWPNCRQLHAYEGWSVGEGACRRGSSLEALSRREQCGEEPKPGPTRPKYRHKAHKRTSGSVQAIPQPAAWTGTWLAG